MSSGFSVNVAAFEKFCFETAELFTTLYSWYCMPTTVHKVLIHGGQIIDWAPLPIGQMSEDAQEARNKDVKNYRENFSRKFSRTATMEDVFHRLLVTSDPYISSMSKIYPKTGKSLCPQAVQLLLSPNISSEHSVSDDDASSSDHDEQSSEESD